MLEQLLVHLGFHPVNISYTEDRDAGWQGISEVGSLIKSLLLANEVGKFGATIKFLVNLVDVCCFDDLFRRWSFFMGGVNLLSFW